MRRGVIRKRLGISDEESHESRPELREGRGAGEFRQEKKERGKVRWGPGVFRSPTCLEPHGPLVAAGDGREQQLQHFFSKKLLFLRSHKSRASVQQWLGTRL